MNLCAAKFACAEIGISETEFNTAIQTFKGAARRLEKIKEEKETVIYKDFAHSPSKLEATIKAVKEQFPDRKLIAVIELHTFSSLNKDFINEYAHTLDLADEKVVFVDDFTIAQKGMAPFNEKEIKTAFGSEEIKFFNQPEKIKDYLSTLEMYQTNMLLMSSGNFGGIDLVTILNKIRIK